MQPEVLTGLRVTVLLLEKMEVEELEQRQGKKWLCPSTAQALFIFPTGNAPLCRLQKITSVPNRSPYISRPFHLCIPVIKSRPLPWCGAGPRPYLRTE